MTKQEFAERIVSMQDTLYRVAYSLCLNRQDVDDAVQECILRAWNARQNLRDEKYLQTWVIRILINECRGVMRRRKPTLSIDAVPLIHMPEDTSNQSLYEAIATLPEALRLTVTLHYIEGYREKEIAAFMKCPQGTVKSRLRKARMLLKESLESDRRDCRA